MLREKLADLCHKQWCGWMRYLFTKGTFNDDGTFTISRWATERWHRQMITQYDDLSETEKDSDRKEADKFIELLRYHGRIPPDNDMSTSIHRALHYVECYHMHFPDSGAKFTVNELKALMVGDNPISTINKLANIIVNASGKDGYISSNDLDYANECLDKIIPHLE